MNLLHLIWIIPLAFSTGIVAAVLCMEAKLSDEEIEEIQDADWRRIE